MLETDDAVARILSAADDEGVTFSGGEPFEQADALAAVAGRIRSAGRSVMVYTGFTLEELRASLSPGAHALLALTDVLVDGPFVRADQRDLLWRGSENQRVHLLTPRYAHLAPNLDNPGAGVELRLDRESNLFWAGVPSPEFPARLRQAVANRGILLTGHEGVWA